MTQDYTEVRKLAETRLLQRAHDDAAFRELLLDDPRQAFREELGVSFPPTVRVQAMEEPADTLIVVVPAKSTPAGDLSDAQLEEIGGGKSRRAESWLEAIAKAMGEALGESARKSST